MSLPFPTIEFFSWLSEAEQTKIGKENQACIDTVYSWTIYLAKRDVEFDIHAVWPWTPFEAEPEDMANGMVTGLLHSGFPALDLHWLRQLIGVANELDPKRKYDFNDAITVFLIIALHHKIRVCETDDTPETWDTKLTALSRMVEENTDESSFERRWCVVIKHLRRFRIAEMMRCIRDPNKRPPPSDPPQIQFPKYSRVFISVRSAHEKYVEAIDAAKTPATSWFCFRQPPRPEPIDQLRFIDNLSKCGGHDFLRLLMYWMSMPDLMPHFFGPYQDSAETMSAVADWLVRSSAVVEVEERHGQLPNLRRMLKYDFKVDDRIKR